MNKVSGEILEELRDSMAGRRYRHFKGRIYIVTDLAVNTESDEIMVIYKCFTDPLVTWCRPLSMFTSDVDRKKKDHGEWIEGYLLDGGMPGEKRIFIGKLVIGKWTIMADEFDEVDPDTICEYTGLTDKNGKKIWENDIVLVTNKNYCSGKIESSIGNIFFTFGTWYIGGKTQDRLYSINNDTIFQIEVVGNIFDNPELLQGSL